MANRTGYCTKTGEVHRLDDFDRLSLWNLLGFRPCSRCGKRVSKDKIRRGKPIDRILDKVENLIEAAKRGYPEQCTTAEELAQSPDLEDDRWVNDLSWSEKKKFRKAKELIEHRPFVEADDRVEREELAAMVHDDLSKPDIEEITEIAETLLENSSEDDKENSGDEDE